MAKINRRDLAKSIKYRQLGLTVGFFCLSNRYEEMDE